MTKLVYPATFEKDSNDSILVLFPDVHSAVTCGDDIQHAFEMAEEVLGCALEDETEFPTPSTFEEIQKKYPDKVVTLISVDLIAFRKKYHSKTIRKSVTVPEWINDWAEKQNVNFSKTLTEAILQKMNVE